MMVDQDRCKSQLSPLGQLDAVASDLRRTSKRLGLPGAVFPMRIQSLSQICGLFARYDAQSCRNASRSLSISLLCIRVTITFCLRRDTSLHTSYTTVCNSPPSRLRSTCSFDYGTSALTAIGALRSKQLRACSSTQLSRLLT